jgi:glutathione S-transferase
MIRLTAFKWVPPAVQGLVRDLRVRWALEEASLPYEVNLIGLGEDQSSESYRELQPFGQVPALEDDGLVLFESGSIVLHIAQKSDTLPPRDENERARVTTWMFAALNSVEPPIAFLNYMQFQKVKGGAVYDATAAWAGKRLDDLVTVLDGHDHLVDRFSAADLLMATVLNILRDTDMVQTRPVLDAYMKRCEARPAYKKALADQLAAFKEHAPA